jgi:hypothetical protein
MTSSADRHSLQGHGPLDAPSYEATLSLVWTPLDQPIGNLRRSQLNEDNLRVLAAVALLDETRATTGSADDGNALDAEVARLHQKLNLVIDLLGFLVARQGEGGTPSRVRLSWQGVVFAGARRVGEQGLVSLGLHRSVPQPFAWPARIDHIDGEECHARFEPFGDALLAAIERHVFLRHRRAVAGSRRSGG